MSVAYCTVCPLHHPSKASAQPAAIVSQSSFLNRPKGLCLINHDFNMPAFAQSRFDLITHLDTLHTYGWLPLQTAPFVLPKVSDSANAFPFTTSLCGRCTTMLRNTIPQKRGILRVTTRASFREDNVVLLLTCERVSNGRCLSREGCF